MSRVATLDANGVLIGVRNISKPKNTDVECGDLPADGSYRWDGKTFIPLGFGQGKPKRPTVSRDRAIYLTFKALIAGNPIPEECRTWCDWFERHGK